MCGVRPEMNLVWHKQDYSGTSDYARASIAACIETGVILGRPNNAVASRDLITSGEFAVILERMLQKSNLS